MSKPKKSAQPETAGPRVPVARQPPLFVTWEEGDRKGRALALQAAGDSLARAERVFRAKGTSVYENVAGPNQSVRDSFSKADYDYFRPGEATPRTQRELIAACMSAYDRVGVVRNIIDLMADFAVQGIELVHPNPRIEKFYREWWRKVQGKSRSERFLNMLYRAGNVIIRRHTAVLKPADQDNLKRGQAADVSVTPPVAVAKNEVPWQYTILNPLSLQVLGGELAPFLGSQYFVFALQVPPSLVRQIKHPLSEGQRQALQALPEAVRKGIEDGLRLIPLESDKVKALYYKRDDWQVWANPMTCAVLDNLRLLKKMELADAAALDGAISQVRLWRLGSLEHRILPTEVAINRLAEMLLNNVGGGVMDLVWGPELDLVETSTEVHRFLGETKYAPVLNAIYAGLGIPPTLTGAATASGVTNNYISLKTLIERLQYGRDVVAAFWDDEVRMVQRSMGFRQAATLRYDRMTLANEDAERALLVQLIDRDLISPETLQERFGEDPVIEEARMRRAARKRKTNMIPQKASPFHDAEHDKGLQKIFAQSGAVAPGELGLTLEDKKPADRSPLDVQHQHAQKQARLDAEQAGQEREHDLRTQKLQLKHGVHPGQLEKQAQKFGVPGQGRPRNKKDAKKRKPKLVRPRAAAGFVEGLAWARQAQEAVSALTAPAYLQAVGKKNLRQLGAEEARNFEDFKFALLANLSPAGPVSGRAVAQLAAGPLRVPAALARLYRKTLALYAAKCGGPPGADMLRTVQAAVVALWHAEPRQPRNDEGVNHETHEKNQ